MRITKITSQHRRDFIAVYLCEHCGHTTVGEGYDDRNFHENVIPTMECTKCGKSAGSDYRPLTTKHPDHAIL